MDDGSASNNSTKARMQAQKSLHNLLETRDERQNYMAENAQVGVSYEPDEWFNTLLRMRGRPSMGGVYWFVIIVSAIYTILVKTDTISDLKLDSKVHGFVGSALMFLLVFRSQASYKKWMDGLKAWTMISFACREIIQQALCYTSDQRIALVMCRFAVAFAMSCRSYLRDDDVDVKALDGILTEEELEALNKSEFVPLYTIHVIRQALGEAVWSKRCLPIHMAIELSVKTLTSSLAECERIRVILPFVYVVHLRTCLLLYLLFLPPVLVDLIGWATIPAIAMIAYVLLGLESTAIELDDPFGRDDNDLPIDNMCLEIQENLTTILGSAFRLAVEAREEQGEDVPAGSHQFAASNGGNPQSLANMAKVIEEYGSVQNVPADGHPVGLNGNIQSTNMQHSGKQHDAFMPDPRHRARPAESPRSSDVFVEPEHTAAPFDSKMLRTLQRSDRGEMLQYRGRKKHAARRNKAPKDTLPSPAKATAWDGSVGSQAPAAEDASGSSQGASSESLRADSADESMKYLRRAVLLNMSNRPVPAWMTRDVPAGPFGGAFGGLARPA